MTTVGRIVGDIYKDLSVKLKNLLQIPSNLYIWQHLDKKQIYGECLTTSNLIDKWFDQICKRSTEVGISSKLVADTTNKIVDTLDGMGRLFAPKMIINIDITGLEYLISAEIIVLQMFELRMLFYEHYPEYAANDYVDVKTMMLKFEERTLRLLSFWIDKKIDSKGKNVYRYEEELVDGKNDFMVKNETMILDRLLKYVPKETGTGVIYSEWSNKYLHKRGIERACVELIKKANIVLCSKRPEEFWEYYNPYMGKGYTVFNEIILHGLAFMPSKYSNQIIEYISSDFDNNIFDYTSGKDNYLESVKEILNVHTVSCSEEVLKKLEEKIYYYKSPNAVRWYRGRIEQNKTKESAPVYWSFWGDLQYELLPCLPEERISEKSRELLRILRRKFYNGKSHY